MTWKERVYTALRHEQPDICPWDFGFTTPAREKMVRYTGDPHFAAKIGNHLLSITPLPPDAWVQIKSDFWRDEFGVVWNRTIDKDIGNEPSAQGCASHNIKQPPDEWCSGRKTRGTDGRPALTKSLLARYNQPNLITRREL